MVTPTGPSKRPAGIAKAKPVGCAVMAKLPNSRKSKPGPEACNASVPEQKRQGIVIQKRLAGAAFADRSFKRPRRSVGRKAANVTVPEKRRSCIVEAKARAEVIRDRTSRLAMVHNLEEHPIPKARSIRTKRSNQGNAFRLGESL